MAALGQKARAQQVDLAPVPDNPSMVLPDVSSRAALVSFIVSGNVALSRACPRQISGASTHGTRRDTSATEFTYERGVQRLPRPGPWTNELDRLLVANLLRVGSVRRLAAAT